MLMLKYPPEPAGGAGSANEVLIEKVLGEGWLATGT
jgi:hypothetical protein